MTTNPARLLGIDAGQLRWGAAADIVLFDPNTPWRIEEKGFHSKSKNTAFDGRPVQGRVLETLLDGRSVYKFSA